CLLRDSAAREGWVISYKEIVWFEDDARQLMSWGQRGGWHRHCRCSRVNPLPRSHMDGNCL
ncbi:hypothetical protein, partial [Pseudomonas sp. S37]|uniref:hypothetical protein n=1 Tax=Pseudomonas sp. S37 TaxID=2767449 RepID=UPI001F48969C